MKKALFVGLTEYPHSPLQWCANDAAAMKELLATNGDGGPNFDPILIPSACTKAALEEAIRCLFSDDVDVALLYFSGHACVSDQGYLCTTDYLTEGPGIPMAAIMDLVNNSKCKNKIIILDCCFAGKMGEVSAFNNSSMLGDGVTIIAASQSWQESREYAEIEHGIFTNLFLQGLMGGAADISGNITPASLYSFVDQSLGPWQQRPVFKTNISRFLPLRTVRGKVPRETLRKLGEYFGNSTDEYKLDPSYEFTNDPKEEHKIIEPYANCGNVRIFKDLQLFESVGLVEPVGEEHMYFAAIKSKACRLTALGKHYWRLSKDKRF